MDLPMKVAAVEPLELRASLGLEARVESARLARRFIVDFCAAARLDEQVCETAALLTSELVTNAVRHGGSSVVLEAHLPPAVLRVSVRDDDPSLPDASLRPTATAEGGRGILLVSTLATRWGVEAVEGGKAVWFELATA